MPDFLGVTGDKIIGTFLLRAKKGKDIKAHTVQYLETDKKAHYSDGKSVIVGIDPGDAAPGDDYELVCDNSAGISDPIKGIAITKKKE